MPNRITRKKLSYEVSEGILMMIDQGKVTVGDQLPPESELTSIFGVSRTSVREAVKSLAAVGVLEIRPGVGTFVVGTPPGPLLSPPHISRPVSRDDMFELLEFRRIIECEAAALAAVRATPEDLEEMERCILELEKGVAARVKPPEDLGFHLALARATKNSALVDVSHLTARFYQKDEYLPDALDVKGHREIYEAIKNRDPQAARTAMDGHIAEIERRYREAEVDHGTSLEKDNL